MSGVVIRECLGFVVKDRGVVVSRFLGGLGKFDLVDVSFSDAGGFECGEVEC